MARTSNPLVSSQLPFVKWMDRLEKLAAVLREVDPDLSTVFEPAQKAFIEQIMWLDQCGQTNVLHQTVNQVLRITAVEIPKSHAAWVDAGQEVWRRAPEKVSRSMASEGPGRR